MYRTRSVIILAAQISSKLSNQRRMSTLPDILSENLVGISAFANTASGFQGILKQRYSDFIVREIDSAGRVARLESMSGKDLE